MTTNNKISTQAKSNVLGRRETTKAMVNFMFVILEENREYTLEDAELVCSIYERLMKRIPQDFMAIASIIAKEED